MVDIDRNLSMQWAHQHGKRLNGPLHRLGRTSTGAPTAQAAVSLVPFVDISHYQGNVDFRKMAASGVQAVLCKVTEGGAEDPKWRQYAHDSRAAGLACGGYHFVNTGSSFGAEGQADKFVAAVSAVGGPLMLHMYDMEWSGVTTSLRGSALAAYYVQCVNRADSQLGRKGSIYTIKSFWRDYTGNSPVLADHDLIVATARGGIPPTDASQWDDWFTTHGGIMAPKYYPIVPWTDWAACQFAVPSGIGPTYGVQSSALDLDVCKPDAFARWTGQEEPDVPLTADDLNAIWDLPMFAGGPKMRQYLQNGAQDAHAGYISADAANKAVTPEVADLTKAVADLKALLADVITDLNDLAWMVAQIPTTSPPGSGMTVDDFRAQVPKIHQESLPGHLAIDP